MTIRADTTVDQLVEDVCTRARTVPGDVHAIVGDLIDVVAPLIDDARRAEIEQQSIARLAGLDVLDQWLRDPTIDEIMVNRGREIWIDRFGELEAVGELAPGAVDVILERVLASIGRRLDRTQPIVDARLPDGSRLCAIASPVACDGKTVSIRRHRARRVPLDVFADGQVVDLLVEVVRARCNLVITGATSSGKTTLLRALLELVPANERLVTIEDTAELAIGDDRHVVRLEAQYGSPDGGVDVDMARLVRASLRLRPDRLITGEFRGNEVLAVVEALNTGHDGSMSTCHANTAVDGLRRIETLVMRAAAQWPLTAVRRHVTGSIDVVVHLRRSAAGARRVDEVLEVVTGDGEPSGRTIVAKGHATGELRRRRR